jgi:integrase
MAEANHSLQQIPTIRITIAAHVLAQLRARNAVKEELRKQGLKPSHYSAGEITGWANVYLNEYPELIPEAIAKARAMILRGDLGKRAQRALAQAQGVHKTPKLNSLGSKGT